MKQEKRIKRMQLIAYLVAGYTIKETASLLDCKPYHVYDELESLKKFHKVRTTYELVALFASTKSSELQNVQ